MELGDFISELDSAMWWAGMAVRQGRYALEAIWHGDIETARLFASNAWEGLVPYRQVWVTVLFVWLGVVATAFGILRHWGWVMLTLAAFAGWMIVASAVAVWFNMLPLLLLALVLWIIVCGAIVARRTNRAAGGLDVE